MVDFIGAITIRARVALYLAVAEHLSGAVAPEDVGYTELRQGLNACWAWLEGKRISADHLHEYLANLDDTGVSTFASMVRTPAWNTAETAMAYLVWQAYKIEGQKYLPADIEEVNEELMDDLLSFAREARDFDEATLEKLRRYLLEHHGSRTGDEGAIIKKSEIIGLLQRGQKG
jgi:Immunity protein Imm6